MLPTFRTLPMHCRCALLCFVTSHENLCRIGMRPQLTCFFVLMSHSDGASSSQGGGPGVQSAAQAAAVAQAAAAAAQRDTVLWVAWLAGCLTVPLLRAHFYATETGTGRQTVCYFR